MSHRNDTNVPYDISILSALAERQGDYNIDLLDEGRDRTAANPPDRQPGAADGYSPGAIALARKEVQLENDSRIAKNAPWYQTRWGITMIVIIVILIIGSAVGGAIGGTRHSSSHISVNSDTTSAPFSATLGGQTQIPLSSSVNSDRTSATSSGPLQGTQPT